MTEYQNALADMSNEAVEYVRGIPVVKTFGQSVFSFKKFKDSIDKYSKWAIAYTKDLRMPMTWYTLAINCVFVFLIIAGIAFTRGGVDSGAGRTVGRRKDYCFAACGTILGYRPRKNHGRRYGYFKG